MLRVLGQRFPQDVDAAVAKLSKYVARSKSESAAAAAVAFEERGEEDVDASKTAGREARREETLSSLLVSTFAGADLAARLPLQLEVIFLCFRFARCRRKKSRRYCDSWQREVIRSALVRNGNLV